jgi:hypothetical protein
MIDIFAGRISGEIGESNPLVLPCIIAGTQEWVNQEAKTESMLLSAA